MSRMSPWSGALALLALALPATASAAANPYERGPAPSADTVQSTAGAYKWTKRSVPDGATPGFGAANVWAPSNSTGETFGAVAIAPGFLAAEATMAWLGPRLAAQGFVVITINTNNVFDQPGPRGAQLLAALKYLTISSSAKALIDPTRLAVVGHSMGGGGALEAAKRQPSLKAAVALAPWNQDKTWPEIVTPTMIISAETDDIAPNGAHSIPFYNSLPGTLPKAMFRVNGMDHVGPVNPNTTIATTTISWLKRFVDNDTRYTPMLCPALIGPPTGSVLTYQNTCGTF